MHNFQLTLITIVGIGFCNVFCAGGANSTTFPENLKRCNRTDPNLNECIRLNAMDAVKKMANGLPSLGIGRLEPLAVESIGIGENIGSVNIRQIYRNVTLRGLCDSVLTTYDAQLDKFRLYTEAITPRLEFNGEYEMSGRVLLLPIQGTGQASITLTGLKTKHTLIGEPFKRKNKLYMKLVDYKVSTEPERVQFHFTNLFNGDELLASSALRFFNEHWRIIFNEMKPQYEKSFGLIFREVSNRIFTQVPFDEIFLN